MGCYFNPPGVLGAEGRELQIDTYPQPQFESLKAQLKPGEVLVGLYDRGAFHNAPYLCCAQEMEAFEYQARTGLILRVSFHAVSQKHPGFSHLPKDCGCCAEAK